MQQFPLTGSPGHDAPYQHVSPERTTPIVSDAQLEVVAEVQRIQAEARANPVLNGQDSRDRLSRGRS